MGYPSLGTIVESAQRLNVGVNNITIRTRGFWHVLIFLRYCRINGGGRSHTFTDPYEFAEASFDLTGIYLPILENSRDVYYEPGATQGIPPTGFFRHRQGPRQTYLNRIYTGLTGAGQKQPHLFDASSNSLPTMMLP